MLKVEDKHKPIKGVVLRGFRIVKDVEGKKIVSKAKPGDELSLDYHFAREMISAKKFTDDPDVIVELKKEKGKK